MYLERRRSCSQTGQGARQSGGRRGSRGRTVVLRPRFLRVLHVLVLVAVVVAVVVVVLLVVGVRLLVLVGVVHRRGHAAGRRVSVAVVLGVDVDGGCRGWGRASLQVATGVGAGRKKSADEGKKKKKK